MPSEIGQLSNLRTLNLRDNELSQLPSEIGQLTDLCYLDISDNNLNTLPLGFGKLLTLETVQNCSREHGIYSYDLRFDDNPLDALPDEVVSGGKWHLLYYLRDEQARIDAEFKRLILIGIGGLAFLALLVLGFRFKQRQAIGKPKKKRS